MYREEILDHYKRPRNEGALKTKHKAEGENSSCGDKTTIYVDVEDGLIKEVKHETDGCAVSTAATSILSEELVGMKVEEVKDLETEWIQDKLGIELSPLRVKCAALPLKTIQEALEDKK